MTPLELYVLSYQYESYSAMSIDLGIRYKELRDKIRQGKAIYNTQRGKQDRNCPKKSSLLAKKLDKTSSN